MKQTPEIEFSKPAIELASEPAVGIVDTEAIVPDRRTSRRQFLMRNVALLGTVGAVHGYDESSQIEVTHHHVKVPGLRTPVRVVQISDLHRSWCVSEAYIGHVIAMANSLKPDLALLTGDFVTDRSEYAHTCVPHLAHLQAPLGSWAVLGNHDYWCDGYHGAPAVIEALKSVGITPLINDSARLDNGLRLVGVDDCRAGHPDVARAFGRVDPREPILAMTHNPDAFHWMCRYPCVTIAGHTHGGQITSPWGARMLMSWRLRYLRGWYREGNTPGRLYVNRGIGTVHLPIRLGSPPELTVFELIPA